MTKIPVITIDGPSGTGKGTITKMLAQHLGWNFLDSGVLYRILGFAARKYNIALDDIDALIDLIYKLNLRFETDENKTTYVFLDNEDVSQLIRSEICAQDASKVGAIQKVREVLLEKQREFQKPPGLVTDGRDMGTVVFPDASLKIYLDASAGERAHRRFLQLKQLGNDVSLAEIVEELAKRDERDRGRECAPLKPAHDAIVIDTTSLSTTQVFKNILKLIK